MNKNDIKMKAEKALTSSFNGYEGQDPYLGKNDPALSFVGSASSFIDEKKDARQYAFTITNTGSAAVDRVLALHPGYLTNVADLINASGVAADAIVTDGTIINTVNATVVCVGKPKKIAQLQAFVNRNPTRFTGLKMLVNDADQFEEELCIRKLSPLGDLGYETITPSTHKDSKQTDDKRVEIPLNNFQLDDQTAIIFTLKAGRTVTFTFFAGAIRNVAGELNQKATAARANMVTRGY